MTIKELQEEFDALNEDVVRDWIKRNGIPAPDPDSEPQDRANDEPKRTQAQGESEELEQLDKIFKRYWPRTILYHSKPQEPWKLDKAKKAVLQWRTKSLLALLPEEEYEGPNNDPHDEHYAHGYNVALQDIKKGIK